jgi:hypothetical protein
MKKCVIFVIISVSLVKVLKRVSLCSSQELSETIELSEEEIT